MATDAAVRSTGFAMVFSPPVRAYGVPLAIVFCVPCTGWHGRAESKNGQGLNVLLFPYLVPVGVLLASDKKEVYRRSGLEVVPCLRFVETILFGILAAAFGRTARGESLVEELIIYIGILLANALSLALFQCFLQDDGELDAPRASTYSPTRILGRAMDTE